MKPVDQIISAFGGIRAFQRKLGEKHASLIQGWQEAGRIPHYRETQIRASAEKHGVALPEPAMEVLFGQEGAPRKRAAALPREAA